MISSLRFLSVVGAVFALTVAVSAAEPAIIAKARARLGPEDALNGVNSVHYVGTLVMSDSSDPKKQMRAAIDIVFQKGDKQRVQVTTDRLIDTTGLDDMEGWRRIQDPADPTKIKQTPLTVDGLKRIRANNWETLSYFRGLDSRRGKVEDLGPATMDGIACEKVAFTHTPNIVFYRYFDLATGRLVYTETESGTTLREEGEIMVSGIRFPKTLVTTQKNPKGETQTSTITIEKATINEVFPPSFFATPKAW